MQPAQAGGRDTIRQKQPMRNNSKYAKARNYAKWSAVALAVRRRLHHNPITISELAGFTLTMYKNARRNPDYIYDVGVTCDVVVTKGTIKQMIRKSLSIKAYQHDPI